MTRKRALVLFLLCAACARPRPPAPPPPPPPAPVEAPPPPPPKCEALEEKCVSTSDTRAKIGETSWTIQPPQGWTFAQGAEVVTVTESAALAVTSYERPKNAAKRGAARDAALTIVTEKIGVAPKKLVWPARPHKRSKVGTLEVSLYQFGGAKRDHDAGPLLVFSAPLTPDLLLIGAAFVADNDKSNADSAVLKAIESLSSSPSPSAHADAGAP